MFPQSNQAFAIKNITNQCFVDFICTNLNERRRKDRTAPVDSLCGRAYRLLILNREVALHQCLCLSRCVHEDIDQQQREYFCSSRLKPWFQDELGGGGQEQEIEERCVRRRRPSKWNDEVKAPKRMLGNSSWGGFPTIACS